MIRNVTSEIGVCRRKVLTLTLVSLLPQHAPIRSHTEESTFQRHHSKQKGSDTCDRCFTHQMKSLQCEQ